MFESVTRLANTVATALYYRWPAAFLPSAIAYGALNVAPGELTAVLRCSKMDVPDYPIRQLCPCILHVHG